MIKVEPTSFQRKYNQREINIFEGFTNNLFIVDVTSG